MRGVDGVAVAEGTISGYAQLLDRQGKPLTTTGAPFLGVSWGSEDELYPVKLDDGRKPVGAQEVAIDRASADDAGFAVGDRTRVLLVDGSQRAVTIVGIFTFGNANNLLGARLTAFDAAVAQELFGGVGQFDSIDVRAAPGVAPAELAARIQSALPAGTEAVTSTTVREEGENTVGGFLDVFQNILVGFGVVAVFVAAFYINNTFSIVLLGQRTRELALLPRPRSNARSGDSLGDARSQHHRRNWTRVRCGVRTRDRSRAPGDPRRGRIRCPLRVIGAPRTHLGSRSARRARSDRRFSSGPRPPRRRHSSNRGVAGGIRDPPCVGCAPSLRWRQL